MVCAACKFLPGSLLSGQNLLGIRLGTVSALGRIELAGLTNSPAVTLVGRRSR